MGLQHLQNRVDIRSSFSRRGQGVKIDQFDGQAGAEGRDLTQDCAEAQIQVTKPGGISTQFFRICSSEEEDEEGGEEDL